MQTRINSGNYELLGRELSIPILKPSSKIIPIQRYSMKPIIEIYPGLSLPIDELEKLVDKYLIIGGTPPRIMAVANDDEEARNKFLDLSDKADLNRETDFPKAIIFLTRDMLKPYL
jgi:hypothetical protein